MPREGHENKEEPIEAHEEMPQEEHPNEKESIEFRSLKEPRVDVSRKQEPTTKVVAYCHLHHLQIQQSSTKGWEHQ